MSILLPAGDGLFFSKAVSSQVFLPPSQLSLTTAW